MEQFLISLIKPDLGSITSKFFVLENSVLSEYSSIADFLKPEKTVISFEFDTIINYQRRILGPLVENFIDLEQVQKQITGKPEKSFAERRSPWSIWNLMEKHYVDDSEGLKKLKQLYFSIDEIPSTDATALCETFLKNLKHEYEASLTLLEKSKEKDRFFNIEKKIAEILLHRSYHGIHIHNTNLQGWIREISNIVYENRNKLQLSYGLFSTTDKKGIRKLIDEHIKITNLDEKLREHGSYYFYKTYRAQHPLLEFLYVEKKANRDLSVLLSIGALTSTLVHPSFDAFGTITSRSKMLAPNFQVLSKKYRSVVSAAPGKSLIYIDFSQFEASILAQQSNDKKLLGYCNTSDVYDEISKSIKLSEFITSKEEQRKFSKILFYRYSYGMDISNHQVLLKDFEIEKHSAIVSPRIDGCFAEFIELEAFRKQIAEEALSSGFVHTNLGNYRYKDDNDSKVSWALSQRIQGTASLILKKAIISSSKTCPEAVFLIPMHDAALFEVDSDKRGDTEGSPKKCHD